MSSARPDTKIRLLDAARGLLEERGPHDVGMDEIARAAGLSRQSAYLHFGSKTGLLLALVEYVDAQRDVADLVEELWTKPSALAALDSLGDLAAKTNPEVHRLAMALDAARRWDDGFEKAWQDRMLLRLARYRRLMQWMEREGSLGTGWSVEDAAVYAWSLTSLHVYDQFVVDQGMSLAHYARLLNAALRNAVTVPFSTTEAE